MRTTVNHSGRVGVACPPCRCGASRVSTPVRQRQDHQQDRCRVESRVDQSHMHVYVDVTDTSGKVTTYNLELTSPNAVQDRAGTRTISGRRKSHLQSARPAKSRNHAPPSIRSSGERAESGDLQGAAAGTSGAANHSTVSAHHADVSLAGVVMDADSPGIAAHLAILDEAPAHVRLNVDLDRLAQYGHSRRTRFPID